VAAAEAVARQGLDYVALTIIKADQATCCCRLLPQTQILVIVSLTKKLFPCQRRQAEEMCSPRNEHTIKIIDDIHCPIENAGVRFRERRLFVSLVVIEGQTPD
jgi:hypothetical protein